jgi:hypothetical protein
MPAGLSGHLLSSSFLEARLASTGPIDHAAHRTFIAVRRGSSALGPATSVRALLDAGLAPLVATLGFDPPQRLERFSGGLAATVVADSGRVAFIVVPWGDSLQLTHVNAAAALQRFARWCALFNGTHLRLIDTSRPYSRRFVQFDLDFVADDEESFRAFDYVMRRLPSTLHVLVEESERHGVAVCRSLREGVLSASADVLSALVRPTSVPSESFEQGLTVVYRILFLLFAEARGLVPVWHPVYRSNYSVGALAALAQRQSAPGLWDALRAIARLAHAGCRAGDLRVTPFNGRLFAPAGTPLTERRDLDDDAARRALVALATRPSSGGGRERIGYRDLGVEQLGTVYETLLDYEPRIHRVAARTGRTKPPVVSLERGSGVRKATGTFYTPLAIAEHLVRRTLGPLVRSMPPERILSLRIVDPAMGSGAFLVAACRYLAAAYERALVEAGGCHASDIGEPERASIRRTIAERCLYGVDVNPMAVQLARLSLWLATLASDRPLSFLDHRLQIGDSLLGTWLARLASRPEPAAKHPRRDALTGSLFDAEPIRRALEMALPLRFSLETIANDTLDDVRAKERMFARLTREDSPLSRWKRVADLWCACWLTSTGDAVPAAAFSSLSDAIVAGSGALPQAAADRFLQRAGDVARERRLFHWELEFPEVFFDAAGHRLENAGFDAVIGNPPWDMIRADAGEDDVRARSRRDIAPMLRFARDAGIYTAQSSGHANRYQLFTERAIALARRGARIGLVLPWGLASDHGSTKLRRRLFNECDVDALVSIDNQRGVFPIHRSVRFLLLTATAGTPTRTIACRLGERDPTALERSGDEPSAHSPWFPIQLTTDLVRRLSGDDLSIPDLRSSLDLVIVERAASLFPPAGDEGGWGLRFGRELNVTDDRASFSAAGTGLPVIEGKHLEAFRVRVDRAPFAVTRANARRLLDPSRYSQPRLAYRDVAGATNRTTFIAAILPAQCVSTHTVFCLRTLLPSHAQHFLCGLFNSFIVNYLIRMRVTTHVTTAIVERLPIPGRDISPRAFRSITAIARRLARRDDVAAEARLQALSARLYQLTPDEFAHVLSTFPLVPKEERDRAFAAFVEEG